MKYKLTLKKRTRTCEIGLSERGLVLYIMQTFGRDPFLESDLRKNLQHCEDVTPLLKTLETTGYITQVLQ